MSLDLSLNLQVGHINLTHNLGKMADNVPAGTRDVFDSESKEMVVKEITLYEAMWRPEEVGIYKGSDLFNHMQVAMEYIITNEDELKQYNPDNGWGDYDGLKRAVKEMGKYCMMFPEAQLESDR